MHADRPPHPLPTGSARARKRIARATLAAALLLGALVTPPSPATAQESEEETSGYTLDLLAQPVWHTGEDDLGIRVRVTNDTSQPLEGFRIRVGVNERVTTRSDLHDRFDVDPGLEPSSIPIDRSETIPAFDSVTVDLDESLASFTTLANSSGGIHPTTLTLQDLQGVEPNLASVTTPLIYYPQVPETPLDLALLLPLNAPPARAPDGTFAASDGSLDDLYGGRSWLTGMISAVQEATTPIESPEQPRRRRGSKKNRRPPPPPPPPPPVHLSLAATPRLIEELADIADGFATEDGEELGEEAPEAEAARQALADIEALFQDDEAVQPVLVPYAFPDIPTLIAELGIEEALVHLSQGQSVMRSILGVEEAPRWFFPPAGRLDRASLENLQGSLPTESPRLFLSSNSLQAIEDPALAGCPDLSPSFTCAIEVDTVEGRSRGFVSDAGLGERLAALQSRPNDRVALQEFFAETAMIREELPNVARRLVHASLPSLWQPSPRTSRLFFRTLRRAPWLRTVTADEGLNSALTVERREIVDQVPTPTNSPLPEFFEAIDDAGQIVSSYGRIVPTDNDRIIRLQRNILTAQSRWWWRDLFSGERYATASASEALAEMNKISIQGAEDITLTSRQGLMQFVLTNGTNYPVRVAIDLQSTGLELEQESPIIDVYEPGTERIEITATARTSGVFPVTIQLQTPNGLEIGEPRSISVRSTSYNEIALALTIGALAFLVLFYMIRSLRKRSRDEHAETTA